LPSTPLTSVLHSRQSPAVRKHPPIVRPLHSAYFRRQQGLYHRPYGIHQIEPGHSNPGRRTFESLFVGKRNPLYEYVTWSVFAFDGIKSKDAPGYCFDAFSSRKPVSTSLENALGLIDIHRSQIMAAAM
jgi:hypothetical protein